MRDLGILVNHALRMGALLCAMHGRLGFTAIQESSVPLSAAGSCAARFTERIFPLSARDEARATKLKSVYRKLRGTRRVVDRRRVVLTEYQNDFAMLEGKLEEIQIEIRAFSEAVQSVRERGGFQDYRNSAHPQTSRFYYEHPAYLDLKPELVLDHYKKSIRNGRDHGPTYEETLYAWKVFPFLVSALMELRVAVHGDAKKFIEPVTSDAAETWIVTHRAAALSFLADLYFLFAGHTRRGMRFERVTEQAQENLRGTITATAIKLGRNFFILPVVYFGDSLLSPQLMAELSWMNLAVLQAPTAAKYFKNLDGSKRDSSPHDLSTHDETHLVQTVYQKEGPAFDTLLRFSLLIRDRPQWMRLLGLLVFYHRHEVFRRIDELDQVLSDYSEVPRSETGEFDELRKRIHDDLGAPTLTPLFDSDWNSFIFSLTHPGAEGA